MRIAQLTDNVVTNIIIADDSYILLPHDVESDFANIGDVFDGENFSANTDNADSPLVPGTIPLWAARTVLQQGNLLDAATTAVNQSTDLALKNVWEYGNFINRNSPAIQSLATALGLTSAQVDEMFIAANNLTV